MKLPATYNSSKQIINRGCSHCRLKTVCIGTPHLILNNMTNKSIRLELPISIYNLLVVLQNSIGRKSGKKASFRKILLYYFYMGLNHELSLKPKIVQEYLRKSKELYRIVDDLYMFEQRLVQDFSRNDAEYNEESQKDWLQKRDLIDQFNLIRAKELQLAKNIEEFAKEKQKFKGKLKDHYQFESKIYGYENKIYFQEKLLELKDDTISQLEKTIKDLRQKKMSLHDKFERKLNIILSHTSQLVRSDNSKMKYVWIALASAVGSLGGKLINENVLKKKNKEIDRRTKTK